MLPIKSIVILGPAHPYRGGGITTFNERLATQFQEEGYPVTIYNFTLQYPSFLFPGKTQYSTEPPPSHLYILRKVNSVNPLNWLKVGNELYRLKPDLVIVRYWIPLMGPALGSILRRVKKNKHTRVIAITDNVIPHERRPGDTAFTKYFLQPCDAVVTMSDKVTHDLKALAPQKKNIQVPHPLYDGFGAPIPKAEARRALHIDDNLQLILFFGFIRKYKGLDILFDALKLLKDDWVSANKPLPKLLVAGEFYGDEKPYQEQIDRLGIRDMLLLETHFISDAEVKNYFCAADLVVQPYRNATQSGVTPLAYHFEKPMVVTRVGALPDYVPHNTAGLVAEPNPRSLADTLEAYFEKGEAYFLPGLQHQKRQYSWELLTENIIRLAHSL